MKANLASTDPTHGSAGGGRRPRRLLSPLPLLLVLAAGIVLVSLEFHGHTIGSFTTLRNSGEGLDERMRTYARIEQTVLELSAPANAAIAAGRIGREQRQFAIAQEQVAQALRALVAPNESAGVLRAGIDDVTDAASEAFGHLGRAEDPAAAASARAEAFAQAAAAAARMNQAQLPVVRMLGTLADRARAEQRDVLDGQEARLQSRLEYQRYFIAGVILLMVGLIWIGVKLERAQSALEAQSRRLTEERRERLAAIGELCSSVAHGIRNPLAAIRSSTQLSLELGQIDDASRDRLQDVLNESARLGDRVNGLLSMARTGDAPRESLALQDVVASTVRSIDSEIARRGLRVEQQLDASAIPLRGDRRQLEQLVLELVSNAVEHSPNGGRILIECRRPAANGTAVIAVEDAGPGVPAGARERVFDLFFTTKPEGTGIGLATVKRIARWHGGDVCLEAPTQGSAGARFVVRLPLDGGGGASGRIEAGSRGG